MRIVPPDSHLVIVPRVTPAYELPKVSYFGRPSTVRLIQDKQSKQAMWFFRCRDLYFRFLT